MKVFKLIADAGSTKVDWALISEGGVVEKSFRSNGLNALLASPEEVEESFASAASELDGIRPDEIHYYGAGCATTEICTKIEEALRIAFGTEKITVQTDLLASARALFGDQSGIACILGTGSNSCFYDGARICRNVPSLGYVLGDEGSGAALGKRLISDVFKGQLPISVKERFEATYSLTLPDILDNVYRRPGANRYLASFVRFIADNIWNPYLYSIVLEEFTVFIQRNVAMYQGAHAFPLGFVGSIAANFEGILREAALDRGYKVAEITASPMEGLIKFHSQEK